MPLGSKATWGAEASCPGSEIVSVAPRVPSAARNFAWMRVFTPSERVHTISVLALPSSARSGSNADCPGSETSYGVRKRGVASASPASAMSAASIPSTVPEIAMRRRRAVSLP